ncbi:MAG: preprotein translocase subunit YajC [Chloroflexi bacterium]|nr:preprotein translocase subunit YajC [Chloroflexota bacterium]
MFRSLIAGLLILALLLAGACTTAPGGTSDQSIIPTIIFLAVIFGIFYFLMVRPQRKRQKEHEQLVSQLQKGDQVITAGGIYGQIESISPDSVIIKLESGATMRVARGSVIARRPLQ